MGTRSSIFIRQFVIGLGFLSGIFTAIGIDPQQEVINLVSHAVVLVYPDPEISYLLVFLPTLLLIISLITAYRKGKVPGLVSVLVAYCAGIVILGSIVISLLLLTGAVVLGLVATNRRLLKNMMP